MEFLNFCSGTQVGNQKHLGKTEVREIVVAGNSSKHKGYFLHKIRHNNLRKNKTKTVSQKYVGSSI
jgi:hypothetical protein